uniref:Uncharacterized protein n=1 Tax=Caenorhabditis japonica TaxID=281687 RepID=A0A8R1DRT8_CAEJA
MELLGWLKRVKPYGKKLFRLYSNPENDLVEEIKNQKNATWTNCRMDKTSLLRVLSIISTMMAAGKIAKCEAKLYDLTFFYVRPNEHSLKISYALCQQSAAGFFKMDPTIFKISEMLTMCEEFSHFTSFRQCHVNLLKSLEKIDVDESVDWFDRVKVLEANILGLINDSDIATRLLKSPKDQKELEYQLKQYPEMFANFKNQYVFSWFNQLHLREICVRGTAAMEVLKEDPAFQNFLKSRNRSKFVDTKENIDPEQESNIKVKIRHHLTPRDPEADKKAKVKRLSIENDSGVLVDADLIPSRRKNSIKQNNENQLKKSKPPKRLFAAQSIYATDVEDLNYSTPLHDGKSFTEINADKVKERNKQRKLREKHFDAGGDYPMDARKRMPATLRKKIRLIARKIMAKAREIQKEPMHSDDLLNLAFSVTDDECSDEEIAPNPFKPKETIYSIREKTCRTFGVLNPNSDAKEVLWWENAKDELNTARAIEKHCVKIDGDSSEPYAEFEEYLGKVEGGGETRNRMVESRRKECYRSFEYEKEIGNDDQELIVIPPGNSFSALNLDHRKQNVGLNSLLLQNLRRRCIDELLILTMIIKGQQQLQDGNVIRCIAYLMLIEFKFAVLAMSENSQLPRQNNFDPFLMHLYKCLLAKFRLYSTDLFGTKCLNPEENLLLKSEPEKFDLNEKCLEFCRDTKALFFCICIRGRAVLLEPKKHQPGRTLEREDVEKQHETFFGLDNANKSTHLSTFWRTEISPIVSGLIHITSHFLLDKVGKMNGEELRATFDGMHGLSYETKNWLMMVTKFGVLAQSTKPPVKYDDLSKNCVPMLFQLPSRIHLEHSTEDMEKIENLEPIYKATTKFVRNKHATWKEACRKIAGLSRQTNTDTEYMEKENLTFFGEAIEKDVYMVAVYKGETHSVEKLKLSSGLNYLCRKIRSQHGFNVINSFSCQKKNL